MVAITALTVLAACSSDDDEATQIPNNIIANTGAQETLLAELVVT